MHLRIRHEIVHTYADPPKAANRKLLLTPRNHEGQHVVNWRIDLDHNCRLRPGEDSFGNIQHCYSVDGPFDSLTITVEGEAETFDTAGVVRGAAERFPAQLFLRETPLTAASAELRAFAQEVGAREGEVLSKLHALLGATHEALTLESGAPAPEGAALAFAARQGSAADLAHVFIACARDIGAPARFIAGYLCTDDGAISRHAWAEAYVDNLGWVGFDACIGASPGENHLRVAAALDAIDAAPLKSAPAGGGEAVETHRLGVAVYSQSQR
jgi:transglutaminase-like putative cysteine protease